MVKTKTFLVHKAEQSIRKNIGKLVIGEFFDKGKIINLDNCLHYVHKNKINFVLYYLSNQMEVYNSKMDMETLCKLGERYEEVMGIEDLEIILPYSELPYDC